MDHLNVLRITSPDADKSERDFHSREKSDTLTLTPLEAKLLSEAHGMAVFGSSGPEDTAGILTLGVTGD